MRKALLIGIDNYPHAPLRGCVNDAKIMSKLLRNHADGTPNFGCNEVLVPRTENKPSLTRGIVRKEIIKLFHGDPEIALLYFSGHGLLNSLGAGFIVTPDATKYDEGVLMDEILAIANQSKARNKIIILDCCHSGAMGNPMVIPGTASMIGDGLTVLAASREDEPALEKGGQGLFTSLIIQALNGAAANLMGQVTPGSLYAHVDRSLGPFDQRPIFKTNTSRFVNLRTTKPPIDRTILSKITTFFENADVEYDLDPSYEFTTDNPNEENVAIFKSLQKMTSVGLVVPVSEEHMYFAAMNSKSCKLTPLGKHYWKLVNDNLL